MWKAKNVYFFFLFHSCQHFRSLNKTLINGHNKNFLITLNFIIWIFFPTTNRDLKSATCTWPDRIYVLPVTFDAKSRPMPRPFKRFVSKSNFKCTVSWSDSIRAFFFLFDWKSRLNVTFFVQQSGSRLKKTGMLTFDPFWSKYMYMTSGTNKRHLNERCAQLNWQKAFRAEKRKKSPFVASQLRATWINLNYNFIPFFFSSLALPLYGQEVWIEGVQSFYYPNELAELTCRSGRSSPPAQLHWTIDGQSSHLTRSCDDWTLDDVGLGDNGHHHLPLPVRSARQQSEYSFDRIDGGSKPVKMTSTLPSERDSQLSLSWCIGVQQDDGKTISAKCEAVIRLNVSRSSELTLIEKRNQMHYVTSKFGKLLQHIRRTNLAKVQLQVRLVEQSRTVCLKQRLD